MKVLTFLFLLLPLPALAQIEVGVENPREYGWWLGDMLEQRLVVTLPEGATLDTASLPRPRSVTYWLDLVEVETRETQGEVEITLIWQNFYSALEPSRREVPSSLIRFSDGTEARLPGFSFVTSPIRPILAPSTPDQLQPDPDYRLVSTRLNILGLGLSTTGLMLSVGLLAFHQAWWPFHRRAARPFTRAARRIASMRGADAGALRQVLHRAFDAAFGRVLISAELGRFLDDRPQFRSLETRLARFFETSNDAFFGRGGSQDLPGEIAALARDLAALERGRR